MAWAGEERSENWFHIAREYTEKWHHQQQIRLAVSKIEALLTKEFYYPFLDISMHALPYHYKNVRAQPDDMIRFTVTGDAGGEWFLMYEAAGWKLLTQCSASPASEVSIDGEIAWRLFTKGINRKEAEQKCRFDGKQELRKEILSMLAVMA